MFAEVAVEALLVRERLWTWSKVTESPTWYIRGGPQTVASGVVTIQSAKVHEGLEACGLKGVVGSR